MGLDPEICYRALRTRDGRFDGRFFIAVRSTGVYCRPTCPARTPRRENCLFLPCAAAAEAAGYRPCRRCRPETAPGTPAWLGTSATVSRALCLIAEGALDRGSVGDLAARLGVGERHLRRLFVTHLGAAPLAVARTRRAHFAAQLLAETDWSASRVAFAAGYTSVRRSPAPLRPPPPSPPAALRARRRDAPGAAPPTLRLPLRLPYDLAGLTAYLATRATPGIETVEAGRLRRALRLGGEARVVEIEATPGAPSVGVRVRGGDPTSWLPLVARTRAVLDLEADPVEIGRVLRRDPLLREAARRRPGWRVPGAWEPFEMAARVVLGQQVTVAGATRLAGRLVARFGEPLPESLRGPRDGDPSHLFPLPDRLADAPLEEIGLPRQRAGALRALAAAVADGRLELSLGADGDAAREALLRLPGVGPWTAELVRMRALNDPDAFPTGDLGLRRALGCDADALLRRAEAWRPWRAYAAMLLWTAPPPVRHPRRGRYSASPGITSSRSSSKVSTAPPGTLPSTPP